MNLAKVLLGVITIAVPAMLVTPRLVLDGPAGVFFWAMDRTVGQDGTAIRGPGYSDWRFLSVSNGMSCAEVEALLGVPLENVEVSKDDPWHERYGPGEVRYWRLVKGSTRAGYAARLVVFRDCTVVQKISGYWFD